MHGFNKLTFPEWWYKWKGSLGDSRTYVTSYREKTKDKNTDSMIYM